MANPYASQAQSSNRGKFKSLTGKDSRGQVHDGDSQKRAHYARGGKVKGNVNINIVVPPSRPLPPMAGPPMMPPPGPRPPTPADLPQGVLPMKNRGGSISGLSTKANLEKWSKRAERNSKFARGGKITGQKGGIETGVGRLNVAKMQKRDRRG